MDRKKYLLSLLGIIALAAMVLVACEQPVDDGGGDLVDPIAVVGDELSGNWVVTFVDSNERGYFAERTSEFDGVEEEQVLVTGTFHDDITFTEDKAWFLVGAVFIGNNAQNPANGIGNTVTIEAGTTVRGDTSSTNPGILIITRGSDIDAQGTAANPITFTSALVPGRRAAGDWGGLIINGYGRVQGGYAEGEGGTGEYGGGADFDDDDNSGIIRYVRIQFAGALFTADNELNSLVLQGVGSGTSIEYIHVHIGADDGIEWFGGSAQVKYYVGTGVQDDVADGDDGWNGSLQHAILQQYSDTAGSLIEADGDADEGNVPASTAIFANITAIAGGATDSGFQFKSDANYDVYNSVVDMQADNDNPAFTENGGSTTDYFGTLIVGGDQTALNADLGTASGTTITNGNELRATGSGIESAVATETDGVWSANFEVEPTAGTFAAQTVPTEDPAGNTLDQTDYIGAWDGTDAGRWWLGWIETPAN